TMIQDILANTTYYIPTDLTVSQEPLTDFQEFLYLVPRIYTNETIFEEQRRYKHAMITTYEACDTYLLKPTNSTVKVSQCGTL
uniref:Glycoprotein B n=1 Tax=Bursaphelenchus xylophilus TaxID=6326 RepID=A0A1I7SJ15_BURXY